MKQLPQIKAAYEWIRQHFDAESRVLSARSDLHGLKRLEDKLDVIERGVFVLMFGQFEVAVDEKFRSAIASRANDPDWSRRRGWDLDHLRSDRVSFATKLGMVMDRHHHAFKQIGQAYGIRNDCAHGGTADPIGSIDALEQNLYRWSALLRD